MALISVTDGSLVPVAFSQLELDGRGAFCGRVACVKCPPAYNFFLMDQLKIISAAYTRHKYATGAGLLPVAFSQPELDRGWGWEFCGKEACYFPYGGNTKYGELVSPYCPQVVCVF